MVNRADYQPLNQSVDEDDEHEVNGLPAPVTAKRSKGIRRPHRPGPIDLSKLDQAFKRWTESIAQKVKGKKKVESDNSLKEILRSVFDPQVNRHPSASTQLKTLDHGPPMTQADFDAQSLSVRHAISEGIHPKMITKGSSGSYFARAKVEGRVQTVAVFKPKDEEPYGRLNPKTTKWLHRKMRWLIPFGRACLIPNLSYISEAAASLLDERLELNIVPKTQLVSFSSQAFFYDWLDRTAAKKGKPLPDKIGSMQSFMHGYQDASDFLRKHPWPGRSIADTFDDSTHRTGRFHKRLLTALKVICGRTGDEEEQYDEDDEEERAALYGSTNGEPDAFGSSSRFYWSGILQQSFREELEKLVILDYIIHNTDRGADNYMIKYCEAEHEKEPVAVAPTRSASLQMPMRRQDSGSNPPMSIDPSSSAVSQPPSVTFSPSLAPSMTTAATSASPYLSATNAFSSTSATPAPYTRLPHIHIAAIDNSLAFPHEHPKGWRSYTYGWLYLPVSLIGPPFSEKTRNHFLPLLTSKKWWEETTYELRKLFSVDSDFNLGMFQRQLAVIKGQAWNVVECLKHQDEGPLELTRRQKVLVWDDEVEVADDEIAEIFNAPLTASPKPSIRTLPPQLPSHRRARSSSGGEIPKSRNNQHNSISGFPPSPIRRGSSSASESDASRPVPFASKMPRVHPGTRGVTVLEHMERVDAVEAGLRRLVVTDPDANVIPEEEEPEEDDVGFGFTGSSSSRPSHTGLREDESSTPKQGDFSAARPDESALATSPAMSPSTSGESRGEFLLPMSAMHSMENSMTEEDLVAMSKSMSVLDPAPPMPRTRWASSQEQRGTGNGIGVREGGVVSPQNLEWMHADSGESRKRVVINERLEVVDTKPLCSWW